jgi:endonuclease/exonuclease/phosphatase family metal-dependent hydrolase
MITAATYNIHKAHSVMRGCHLSALKNGLDELNADLICLQEVQDINTKRAIQSLSLHGASQVSALQGERYPYIAYGANAVYAHGNHGNAILSKYPIRMWQNLDVSDHRLEQRGILHAVLVHPRHGEVHVVCVHFGLFNVSRIRQAKALIHHVQHNVPENALLVIAGDFNDWSLHVHQLLTQALGLKDAIETMQLGQAQQQHGRIRQLTQQLAQPFKKIRSSTHLDEHQKQVGRTFPSVAPWFKLDRLYVRGFEIKEAHIKSGRVWRERSDHAPICAVLTV